MQVIHSTGGKEKRGEGSSVFFLSCGKGGYLALGEPMLSQYLGWFSLLPNELELYKTIEDFKLSAKPEKIVIHPHFIERSSDSSVEKFALINNNSLAYAVSNYEGNLELQVDFRRIHDYDEHGRIYEVSMEKGIIIVTYRKFYDDSLSSAKEQLYMAISTEQAHSILDEWIGKKYSYDSDRSIKSDFFIRKLLSFDLKRNDSAFFGIGFSPEKSKAIANALLAVSKKGTLFTDRHKDDRKDSIELGIAKNSLNSIVFNDNLSKLIKSPSIFAGYPWFYQVWSRDEIISTIGLIRQNKFEEAKKILFRNLGTINTEGMLPCRFPETSIASADGVGWLFKRIYDLILSLEHKNIRDEVISEKDLGLIYSKLCFVIEKTMAARMRNGLVWNGPLETWMDTSVGNSDRAGAKVEIQALQLAMLRLAEYLDRLLEMGRAHEFKQWEHELKTAVRNTMMADGVLLDGLYPDGNQDRTMRPNVFLAYYLCPGLLNKFEWTNTFDKVLEECYLEWGGLSSISKSSGLFQQNHTGIDNRSYHHGDSWYYLNNIAALCLHEIDAKKYSEKIAKIAEASKGEMLFSGFLGSCAEISSASHQSSEGCLSQAWSSATLIELMCKLK